MSKEYWEESMVKKRAKKEAGEVFRDEGNYDLYGCKRGEYYIPSYYKKDGTLVMGYCRRK
jgi:hypothetical protein